MNNKFYVYHHNDRDGKLSAVIIYYYLKHSLVEDDLGDNIIFVECDYSKPIEKIDEISLNDIVYIVDFSFPIEDMERLYNRTKNIIWIDHHETAINKFKGTLFESLNGIRYSSKEEPKAACMLCYEYTGLNKDKDSEIVKLASSYDTFEFEDKEEWWKDKVLNFHYETNYYNIEDLYALFVKELNFPKIYFDDLLEDILNYGAIIKNNKHKRLKESLEDAFEYDLEGYRCLVLNTNDKSSLVFGDRLKDYDYGIVFRFNGEKYSYSIYADKDNDLKANEVAVKYGGGGHAKSSGFTLDYNLFDKIKNNN